MPLARVKRPRRPSGALVIVIAAWMANAAPGLAESDANETTTADAGVIECSHPVRGSPGAAAGGRLGWLFADDLDLAGDLWADAPLWSGTNQEVFGSLDMRTAISRTTSELTFLVREVDYDVRLGWRGGGGDDGITRFDAFVGQKGRQNVDFPGQPFVRYVAAGARLGGGERYGWTGAFALGTVVEDREVDADALVNAEFHYRRPWRKIDVGFDVQLDALAAFDGPGDGFDADVAIGPRIGFRFAGNRQIDLFAHLLRGRNPLGMRVDGLWVGLDVAETRALANRMPGFGDYAPEPDPDSPGSPSDPGENREERLRPGIDGEVAIGAGDARQAARLLVGVRSPTWRAHRAVLWVDANLVTADDTGDLYYFYHVGIERDVAAGRGDMVVGGWFYHRSNHVWAESNPTVTSINVFEAGVESQGWSRPFHYGFDYRARVGYLVDSKFGEDRRWHLRGGVRYAWWGPYVLAEAETGDVQNVRLAAGYCRNGVDYRVEYRYDDQWFSVDRNAWLVLAGVRY